MKCIIPWNFVMTVCTCSYIIFTGQASTSIVVFDRCSLRDRTAFFLWLCRKRTFLEHRCELTYINRLSYIHTMFVYYNWRPTLCVSNIICISVHDSHSDLLGVCPLSLSQTLKFSWITKLCWHLFNLLITVHYMCLPVMKEQINAVWFGFLSGHESEPYIWFEAPFDFNNYLPYLSIRVLHSKWDCFVW